MVAVDQININCFVLPSFGMEFLTDRPPKNSRKRVEGIVIGAFNDEL